MSTNIYEGLGLIVTRFACGKCGPDGPCFQLTGDGSNGGDFVVIHRGQAEEATYSIMRDLHDPNSRRGADPCVEDEHRGVECNCCHVIEHCCSHHCCCFYRCECRHASEEHPGGGKCGFGDCGCQKYVGR